MKKYVYLFLPNKAEGSAQMVDLLGGKGANLAEMTTLGIPVPPGFTISTEVCTYYMKHNKLPRGLKNQVAAAIKKIESYMHLKFSCTKAPLLFSVRSGARQSMPGMMETVLNIGLCSTTIPGLIGITNNPRFVYDAYRRLMMMYSDVVLEKANNNFANKSPEIRLQLEQDLNKIKKLYNYKYDSELTIEHLQELCKIFHKRIIKNFNLPFPDSAEKQLWESIIAVLKSWNGKRALEYRKIENIPNNWGTAVNIQCMVFGNMGDDSGTGVAFTKNPATGENYFFGEWLPNAQGEDVVAGIRTPFPLNNYKKKHTSSLESVFPKIYKQLYVVQKKLENHFLDMQDLEFTIQNNKLWLLQTRVGKRNGLAAVKIGLHFLKNNKISLNDFFNRISANQIDELLHPTINPSSLKGLRPIASGLPAGPGSAYGKVLFNPDDAEAAFNNGEKVILVREETSPEDIHGMHASQAILTSHGGMTSHAALVARGWGKCCIVGCKDIKISYKNKYFITKNNVKIQENEWITLNGTQGEVFLGKLPLKKPNIKKNDIFNELLNRAIKASKINVRCNADTEKDALTALSLSATGIGLCRTEHMFFDPNRINKIRKMIIVNDPILKRKAIMELLPFQEKDFYKILKTMNNLPVTIRLLDPPLHEFLPNNQNQIAALAKDLQIKPSSINERISELHESNPMLGHRGCRLGITFPEITEMQTLAIANASIKLIKEGFNPKPEIMIPLIGSIGEYINQHEIIKQNLNLIETKHNIKLNYSIGTMIELPRACLIADKIAKHADFLSFGTNDLTQTTFGFSRDDIGSFINHYLQNNIIDNDPFQVLDTDGVGELIKIAVQKARSINKKIKIGICGEHGGDPQSIKFLYSAKIDYVSCSPYRIPIAYLTLAQLN